MQISARVVKEWIALNSENVWDLNDVARHFGVSVETLEREFSWNNGTSLSAFIRDAKMQRAAEYLRTTGLPWNEITWRLKLGRADSASHSFKREWGMTVTEYRRKYSNVASVEQER
jgi:AraC-like DNA-binding protein